MIIPHAAGVGSALGFLWAPVSYQAVRSFYQRLDNLDFNAVNALLDALSDSGASGGATGGSPGAD